MQGFAEDTEHTEKFFRHGLTLILMAANPGLRIAGAGRHKRLDADCANSAGGTIVYKYMRIYLWSAPTVEVFETRIYTPLRSASPGQAVFARCDSPCF
jgi:hypothetical protein